MTPKKRKDKLLLEVWRPLSLLTVDYKIATKVIAHRISSVLPIIAKEGQTGYVKGRYIRQNVRLITDITKVRELENISGLAIFIDSIRWIVTSSSGRCKFLTLAHVLKIRLECRVSYCNLQCCDFGRNFKLIKRFYRPEVVG